MNLSQIVQLGLDLTELIVRNSMVADFRDELLIYRGDPFLEVLAISFEADIPGDVDDFFVFQLERAFPNLEAIDLSSQGITKISENFGLFKNLRILNLENNQIETIPATASQSFAQITSLDLSNNKIKLIAKNFTNLTALQELDLSRNQLTKLPNTFSNLTSLSFLDISANNITTLPDLSGLVNLETLLMKSPNEINTFTSIVGSLSSIPKLRELYMEGNPSDVAPSKKFNSSDALANSSDSLAYRARLLSEYISTVNINRILSGQGSSINQLGASTLSSSDRRSLYGSDSIFLSSQVATFFKNLYTLSLSNMWYGDALVSSNLSNNLTNLEFLRIQNCNLREIPPFVKDISLQYLNLNFNKISNLSILNSSDISNSLQQLYLDATAIDGNDLNSLHLPKLKELSVSFNSDITSLILAGMPELERLNAQSCKLQSFFVEGEQLQTIILANNRGLSFEPKNNTLFRSVGGTLTALIDSTPKLPFILKVFIRMFLSSNQFPRHPDVFRYLTYLDLSNCFSEFKVPFLQMQSYISYLDLSGNPIPSDIETTRDNRDNFFKYFLNPLNNNLPPLRLATAYQFSENPITFMGPYQGLPGTDFQLVLGLSNINLQTLEIPSGFGTDNLSGFSLNDIGLSPIIQGLDLSNNPLSKDGKDGVVPSLVFSNFPNLEYLNLSGCGLTTLETNCFATVKIKTIALLSILYGSGLSPRIERTPADPPGEIPLGSKPLVQAVAERGKVVSVLKRGGGKVTKAGEEFFSSIKSKADNKNEKVPAATEVDAKNNKVAEKSEPIDTVGEEGPSESKAKRLAKKIKRLSTNALDMGNAVAKNFKNVRQKYLPIVNGFLPVIFDLSTNEDMRYWSQLTILDLRNNKLQSNKVNYDIFGIRVSTCSYDKNPLRNPTLENILLTMYTVFNTKNNLGVFLAISKIYFGMPDLESNAVAAGYLAKQDVSNLQTAFDTLFQECEFAPGGNIVIYLDSIDKVFYGTKKRNPICSNGPLFFLGAEGEYSEATFNEAVRTGLEILRIIITLDIQRLLELIPIIVPTSAYFIALALIIALETYNFQKLITTIDTEGISAQTKATDRDRDITGHTADENIEWQAERAQFAAEDAASTPQLEAVSVAGPVSGPLINDKPRRAAADVLSEYNDLLMDNMAAVVADTERADVTKGTSSPAVATVMAILTRVLSIGALTTLEDGQLRLAPLIDWFNLQNKVFRGLYRAVQTVNPDSCLAKALQKAVNFSSTSFIWNTVIDAIKRDYFPPLSPEIEYENEQEVDSLVDYEKNRFADLRNTIGVSAINCFARVIIFAGSGKNQKEYIVLRNEYSELFSRGGKVYPPRIGDATQRYLRADVIEIG